MTALDTLFLMALIINKGKWLLVAFLPLWYNGRRYHPYTGTERGCATMSIFSSFLLSVLASVVAYYICKWLSGDKQALASLRHKPPCPNGIEKPRRSQLRGFLRATMSTFVFLAYWHYSICLSAFQVCPTSTTYKPYALQVLSLECSPLSFLPGGSPAIL